jgi:hypothetical protein
MTTLTLSDQAADVVKTAVMSQRRLLEASRQAYRRRLSAFEHRYGMGTTRFVHRFQAGQLGDEPAWFDWLFAHQAHRELSKRLALLRGVRL